MSGLRRSRSRQGNAEEKDMEADGKVDGSGHDGDEELQEKHQQPRALRRGIGRRGGAAGGREAGTAEEKASLLTGEHSGATATAEEKTIRKSDILKFIRVYLPNDPRHDYSDIFPRSAEFTLRGNKRVVFVEDARTGQFVPVELSARDSDALVQNALQGADHDGADADEETALLQNVLGEGSDDADEDTSSDPTQHFEQAIKAITFMCQGLFAGFAFTTLYAASVAPDTTSFLETYQDVANETRRLMFVLCTISVIGAVEQLVASPVSSVTKFSRQPAHAAALPAAAWDQMTVPVLVALYCVCFLCTLVMSAVDTRIEYKDGHEDAGDDWAELALDDHNFERALEAWMGLNAVRFVTAMLAWIVAGLRLLFQLQHSAAQAREIDSGKGTIRVLTNSIIELRGNRLDRLDEARLRQLIHIHKTALDRTQQALAMIQG